MTLLVQAADLHYAHGGNQIFTGLSLEIRQGDRLALIGENGSGKSTLFKLLARRLTPDAGVVTHRRRLSIGYLAQEPELDPAATAHDALAAAAGDPGALDAELRDLEARMAAAGDDEALAAALDAYDACLARLEANTGGEDAEARIATTFADLGLPHSRWDVPIGRLSGGEKKLVGLARLALDAADLLLLDEPDNHLDERGKAWLGTFVRAHRGAVAVISHDRWFIDHAVNRIAELEDGTIEHYPGNYSTYVVDKQTRLERRAQLRDLQLRQYKKLKASAEQLTQWARQNPKFANRAENQRRRMSEERERLESTPAPVLHRRRIDVDFSTERGGTLILEAEGLAKSFGASEVLAPFDLIIRHGEAVGLVGPNGAGKSTFFRMVMGQEAPNAGRLRLGPSVQIGYYAQEQETLDPAQTPLGLVRGLQPLSEQQALGFLAGYLFDRDDAINTIGRLSGGERARLQIASLVLRGATFLLLDEPTNNLDLTSIEALETALLAFPGAILTISHDRYFLDRICTRIVELDAGVVREYPGGWSYYDEHRGRGRELTRRPPPPPIRSAKSGKAAKVRR